MPRRARCVRVAEADATAARLDEFVARCEGQLADLLRDGATPDAALAHAIATAKVRKKRPVEARGVFFFRPAAVTTMRGDVLFFPLLLGEAARS